MSTKKRVERWQFDYFVDKFGQPLFEEVQESEGPDFLVHANFQTIGIELTELHRPVVDGARPLQEQEALRRRIVARAKDIFMGRNDAPLQVSLMFNDSYPLQRSDVEGLAERIVSLLEVNVPSCGSSYSEEFEWVNRAWFPEQLNLVSARHLSEIKTPFFALSGATYLLTLKPEDVRRVLERKEKKYSAYRNKCGQVWLVVGLNTSFISTWFDICSEVLSQRYQSSFDRVFLVSYFSSEVLELDVRMIVF